MSAIPDDVQMLRSVYELNAWINKQGLDPAMAISVLISVLSEQAVAHNYKLLTVAEQLILCGAEYHDEWAKRVVRQ